MKNVNKEFRCRPHPPLLLEAHLIPRLRLICKSSRDEKGVAGREEIMRWIWSPFLEKLGPFTHLQILADAGEFDLNWDLETFQNFSTPDPCMGEKRKERN